MNARFRASIASIASVAALFAEARAHANAAATFFTEPENAGAVLVRSENEGITVVKEELALDCDESYRHDGSCRFSAIYRLENAGDVAITARGAFYGATARDESKVTLDGAPLPEISSADERSAIDAAFVAKLGADRQPSGLHSSPAREGHSIVTFELSLAPHARGVLAFTGALRPIASEWDSEGYDANALRTRHLYFVDDLARTTSHYRYLVAPIRAWKGDPEIDVRIRAREGLDFAGAGATTWSVEADGAHHAIVRAQAVDALEWQVAQKKPRFVFGGPTLGIGGRLDHPELRLRAGVEGSIVSTAVVEGLHVETDAQRVVTAIPSVDVGTPDVMIVIPSVSAGVGMPVRAESGSPVRVGFRTELTIQLPLVGVLFPIDYFPATGPRNDHWDVSLLARLSL